jgi:hypothetical protein
MENSSRVQRTTENYSSLSKGPLKPCQAGQAITDHYMKLEKLYDSALAKIN